MSLSKYAWQRPDERSPRARSTPAGESLFYRSHLPYPVASNEPPLLTDQELEEAAVPAAYAEVKTFRLWLPEHRKEYQEVLDLAANGQVQIVEKIPRFVETDESGQIVQDMIVYVEWVRQVLTLPPGLRNLSATTRGS